MSATNNTVNPPADGATPSSSRSNSTADSYIGSLISLTSKSEIRYEGVLYDINPETSSIGLKNVRSFGTEGRKKDGPQIPPSDKVYEYILFRGSDIKDLQVKSSPPAQPTPPINNDPAIIQSHSSCPVSTSANLPSSRGGSLADFSSQNTQMGLPGSNFQGGIPLYQPGGNFGTWGASPPPPNANAGGLAMPMYWQGCYGPPNGLPPMHQPSLVPPPLGMPMPPAQHPMQYPNYSATLPPGASNFSAPNLQTNFSTANMAANFPSSNLPASLAEISSPFLASTTSPVALTTTPLAPTNLPANSPPMPSVTAASETLPTLMPNKALNSSFPAANLSTSVLSPSPVTTYSTDLNIIAPPLSSKPNASSDLLNTYPTAVQSSSAIIPNNLHKESPTPSLITPGQLIQTGLSTLPSSQPVQIAHKDVEVVQVSSELPLKSSTPVTTEAQRPLLPLPVTSQASQKPKDASFSNHHGRGGYRGRERGRGAGRSRPVMNFTEDFDFMAMNEKFNKDEVWGHLGKSNKSHWKGNEDGKFIDEDDAQDEDEESAKPVYNKDDFFDSLSYNALDRESQNGRTRFSEQMKLNAETFGEFSRYRGGRGGHGPPRGGRSRGGSYYGRGHSYGYGYVGRGRGHSAPRSTP